MSVANAVLFQECVSKNARGDRRDTVSDQTHSGGCKQNLLILGHFKEITISVDTFFKSLVLVSSNMLLIASAKNKYIHSALD